MILSNNITGDIWKSKTKYWKKQTEIENIISSKYSLCNFRSEWTKKIKYECRKNIHIYIYFKKTGKWTRKIFLQKWTGVDIKKKRIEKAKKFKWRKLKKQNCSRYARIKHTFQYSEVFVLYLIISMKLSIRKIIIIIDLFSHFFSSFFFYVLSQFV